MKGQVRAWVTQVHDATGFLKRLYVDLKDPVQKGRAEAAGAYARERQRSAGRLPGSQPAPWIGLPSAEAERIAWIRTIEGLLGLNLLVALGGASPDRTVAGTMHHRINNGLSTAIQGFSAAFPADVVTRDLDSICEEIVGEAADVAEAVWLDVKRPDEGSVTVREFLKQEWLGGIREKVRSIASKTL